MTMENYVKATGDTECNNSKEIMYDLGRLELLKQTIEELEEMKVSAKEKFEKECKEIEGKIKSLILKDAITHANDKSIKKTVENLKEEINGIEMVYDLKIKKINFYIDRFNKDFQLLYNKKIVVNSGDLLEEIKSISNSDIHCNISLDIISFYASTLSKIMKKYKDKNYNLELTISDKEYPEYNRELNEILYMKTIPTKFEEIQADREPLSKHLRIRQGLDEDGRRYSCFKIDDISSIKLQFCLGDLIKENDNWKPLDLIKSAICNAKDKEYNENIKNQKVKRI